MYRHSLDNIITYSSEDIVLFKESPFASWMERLTLENPQHGISPDGGTALSKRSIPAQTTVKGPTQGGVESLDWGKLVELRQAPGQPGAAQSNEIVKSLSAEGKVVVMVDANQDESQRCVQTLDAMKKGADLIVNGQLASGPLSDTANLLMRSSGFSDFGNYLYIPCDTGPVTTSHSAFRLCFLADLLHTLQGQLPPKMFIIRTDSDMVALQVEDHIYYYRAVKQRFMAEQRQFRNHRMPDPSDSNHFGRWSECARDVLKQRALGEDKNSDETVELDQIDEVAAADAEVSQNTYTGTVTRAAPAAALRSQPRNTLAQSLEVSQDELFGLSFNHDSKMAAQPVMKKSTPPPPASLVDRDVVVAYDEVAAVEVKSGMQEPPKPDETEDRLSRVSNPPSRPFSSVLITSTLGEY